MPTPRALRTTLPLLLAVLAWSAGIAATAVHFHGVAHRIDARTGELIHIGPCLHGHGLGHGDGHGSRVTDSDSVTGSDSTRATPDPTLSAAPPLDPSGPEPCLLVQSLVHGAGTLETATAPVADDAVAVTLHAPGGSAAIPAIELLRLAPKLPPPPAVAS